MKIGYKAISKNTGEEIEFFAHSLETSNRLGTLDARNWVINHLDTSKNWMIVLTGKFKHD